MGTIMLNRRKAIKRVASLGIAVMITLEGITDFLKYSNIHFVGLGGEGCNSLEYIFSRGIKAHYTCITTPVRQNLSKDISFVHYNVDDYLKNEINLSNHINHKYPGIQKYLKDDWENDEIKLTNEIKNIFSSKQKYILLAGLGGYTGTKLCLSLFDYLTRLNKDFHIIGTYPFTFEGKKLNNYATRCAEQLSRSGRFSGLHLEDLRKKYGNVLLREAFQLANEEIYYFYTRGNYK